MQACPVREVRISLRKLLPEAEFVGCGDIVAGQCASDSRRVGPGDVFAALPGMHHDGRDFIAEAIARGCSAILSPTPLPEAGVPVCVVPHVRAAFGHLCQALAGNPTRHLRVIGVTGTNGKTTTTCLIARMLATSGYKVGLLGTLGYFDGAHCDDATLTTPPADQLAHYFARMVENGCTHAVMEVSSHALDQSRLAGVDLDALCVTNVRRDHLDYHRTMEDYCVAKSKALDYLAPEGFAVINADDPTSAGYLHLIDGPVLTVAMRAAAEITGTLVDQCLSEQTFLLTAGSDTTPVRTRMIGRHHVYNCLEAAAVGLAQGLDLPAVVRGLESVEYIPGRLQRIECGQPFGVFVDYAHTPDALEGCLATLRDATPGRLICVFGGDEALRGEDLRLLGRTLEAGANLVVITSSGDNHEDDESHADEIVAGLQQPQAARRIADRGAAIAWALGHARQGDCVLIAGKRHDARTGSDEAPEFDDRQVARDWLYKEFGGPNFGHRAVKRRGRGA